MTLVFFSSFSLKTTLTIFDSPLFVGSIEIEDIEFIIYQREEKLLTCKFNETKIF